MVLNCSSKGKRMSKTTNTDTADISVERYIRWEGMVHYISKIVVCMYEKTADVQFQRKTEVKLDGLASPSTSGS
jgi:hypothetical protein